MTRLCLTLLLTTLAASTAQPQVIYDPSMNPLAPYLELTEVQSKSISDTNRRFRQYESSRAIRKNQLEAEINEETARDTIDPQALGLRHRELELIRREIEAERVKTRTELLAVLTAAQKTKLGTLEQSLRQWITACAAVDQNLIDAPSMAFASFLLGFASPLNGPCSTLPRQFIPVVIPPRVQPPAR